MSTRTPSRLHVKTPSMENMDDELVLPMKRVTRKKKPKVVLSSDSDDTIIIEDDEEVENKPPKSAKKKVVHRRRIAFVFFHWFCSSLDILAEIPDDDLDVYTKKAIKEQTERDKRIQMQQEREELIRLERRNKQNEYNGNILNEHEQKQLPVAFELVLETNPNTHEIVIEVDLMLVQYMKQHQGK